MTTNEHDFSDEHARLTFAVRPPRRPWILALALLCALTGAMGAITMQSFCERQARITDTHGQTGIVWSIASDPTVAPGLLAPMWQFAIRTDVPSIYYKSGVANTAWTLIGQPTVPPTPQNVPSGDVYGNCSDGDHTVAGTETITHDMSYATLTVPAGQTLVTNGFRVFACVGIVGAGTISGAGGAGTSAVQGSAQPVGTVPGGSSGGGGGFSGFRTPKGYFGSGGAGVAAGPPGFNGNPGGVGAGGSGGCTENGGGATPNSATAGAAGVIEVQAASGGYVVDVHQAIMGAYWSVQNSAVAPLGPTTGGGGTAGCNATFGGEGGKGGASGSWMVVAAPTFGAAIVVDDRGGYGGDGAIPTVPGHASSGGGGGGGGYLILVRGKASAGPTGLVTGGLGGVGHKLDPGAPDPRSGGAGGDGTMLTFTVGP